MSLVTAITLLLVQPLSGQLPSLAQAGPLQITQGIQNPDNRIPVISGRTTWVRVPLRVTTRSAARVWGNLLINTSKGTRRIPSRASLAVAPALSPASTPVTHRPLTLDFVLPADLTRLETVRIRGMELFDSVSGMPIKCHGCADSTRLRFGPPVVLRLRVIGFQTTYAIANLDTAPRPVDFASLRSWLERAYPVSRVEMDTLTVYGLGQEPSCEAMNLQLARIRALDIDGGQDPRTRYYGLLADGGWYHPATFPRGCSLGVSDFPDAGVVATGPAGTPFDNEHQSWDNDSSYADWYGGHELGHTLGLRHPGWCGEQKELGGDEPAPIPEDSGHIGTEHDRIEGLDILTGERFDRREWSDVMTYCPKRWVGGRNYIRIMDRLHAEDLAARQRGQRRLEAKLTRTGAPVAAGNGWLNVIVELSNLDWGVVDRLTVFGVAVRGRDSAVDQAILDTIPSERRVRLNLHGAGGQVIRSVNTWSMVSRVLPGKLVGSTPRQGVVNAYIRPVAGATALCVQSTRFCAELSSPPPTVWKTNHGPQTTGGGAPGWSFDWSITEVFGEKQIFYLALSRDGGRRWLTRDQVLEAPLTLPCAALAGEKDVRVRIVVATGYRSDLLYQTDNLLIAKNNPCRAGAIEVKRANT